MSNLHYNNKKIKCVVNVFIIVVVVVIVVVVIVVVVINIFN